MDDRRRRRRATLQATAKLSLYVHFAVYVAVNALLVGINLATSEYHWFWWPLLGWGLALALHALALVAIPKLAAIHSRMVDKEMNK